MVQLVVVDIVEVVEIVQDVEAVQGVENVEIVETVQVIEKVEIVEVVYSRGQKSEVRGQRLKNGVGLLSMEPSIFPTEIHLSVSRA